MKKKTGMDLGYVKFISPRNPALAKYIKGYYVHSCKDENFYTKLTFYQNITTTISIYKDSKTTSKGRLRKQSHTKNLGFSTVLAGLVDKYQEVEFFGPLDRLAIVFYPGGLNHFIKKPLSNYLKIHFSIFDYFETDFQKLLPKIYEESNLELKRDYLDEFFIQHFEPLNEPKLLQAINYLVKTENDLLKVNDLSNKLGVNRRTLLRKFKKHLGYSIEEYISVIKFRRALDNFKAQKENLTLSRIAHSSSYYDQSDFTNNLKSRSGLTPKELFSQLEIIDKTLFWKP